MKDLVLAVPNIEIRKTDFREVSDTDVSVAGPEAVMPLLRSVFDGQEQESVVLLTLDARNRVTGWREVARGACNNVQVPVREIFRYALAMNAVSVMISHNHPSGNPAPSQDDYLVTTRVKMAGDVLGVPLLDHVVVGDAGKFYSFAKASAPPSSAPPVGEIKRPAPEFDEEI